MPTHSATSHAAWWRQTLAVNTGLRWSAVQVPACDKLSYCYAVRCGYECIKAFTLSSEISPNCWIATKPVFVGFKWFVEAFTYLFWGFSTLSSRDGKNKLSTLFPICALKVKQKSAALVLCGPPASVTNLKVLAGWFDGALVARRVMRCALAAWGLLEV